jgi:hypothetical protein
VSAPVTDTDTVAGVREALAGGHLALGRERGVAAYLEGKYPGLGRLVLAAHRFHSAAALWALTTLAWSWKSSGTS